MYNFDLCQQQWRVLLSNHQKYIKLETVEGGRKAGEEEDRERAIWREINYFVLCSRNWDKLLTAHFMGENQVKLWLWGPFLSAWFAALAPIGVCVLLTLAPVFFLSPPLLSSLPASPSVSSTLMRLSSAAAKHNTHLTCYTIMCVCECVMCVACVCCVCVCAFNPISQSCSCSWSCSWSSVA